MRSGRACCPLPMCDDRPISTSFAPAWRSHPLLYQEAAEPGIDQTLLNLSGGFTELFVSYALTLCPTIKLAVLENANGTSRFLLGFSRTFPRALSFTRRLAAALLRRGPTHDVSLGDIERNGQNGKSRPAPLFLLRVSSIKRLKANARWPDIKSEPRPASNRNKGAGFVGKPQDGGL